jgi:SAM-dependent methyltransferase
VTPGAIRPQYEEHGADEYYRKFGASYRNPHEPIIQALIERAIQESNLNAGAIRVLDLACGSGEATLALRALGFSNIDGVDPYTGAAYYERTGQSCEAFTFDDITCGVLGARRYDLCVCSFALHLAPASILPSLSLQLAMMCRELWILTPHKRPYIKEDWGWRSRAEILMSRVRLRVYDSAWFPSADV